MNDKNEKSVSIIMLVHNEAEIIEDVIRDYCEKVAVKLRDVEFIIAEDGSTDGTQEILARLEKELPIKVYSFTERKGYVGAYRDAMRLATKQFIFFSDSSGKHDPRDFWELFKYAGKYDIVSGKKVNRQDPFYRIVITKVFNFLVSSYYRIRVYDIDSGFKIIRREAMLDVLNDEWLMKELISFEVTVRLIYKGYSLKEVPVSHTARVNGPSRGLPLKSIPKAIFRTLRCFPKIYRDVMGK